MVANLIGWCVRNRAMVLLLTLVLVLAGMWAVFSIRVDAIPDLSDVQVILRTEYPGQTPEIVEQQVTYPLTTAMQNVPRRKAVRGISMFGVSFVYIIFEDGTDIYWARSRVLEQISFLSGRLPRGVNPQLGPDATGVGWVYEYVLITGQYCPDHPGGAWRDPVADRWYAQPEHAPDDPAVRRRLVHHRVFAPDKVAWFDRQENRTFWRIEDAPEPVRPLLERVVLEKGLDRCPLDGQPLKQSEQDLSHLRSLQDWFLRFELQAIEGVSEVAALGGFVRQYQVVADPVRLQARGLSVSEVKAAVEASNLDVGGRLIETSETEYMVRGVGYLGSLTQAELAEVRRSGRSIERLRSDKVLVHLRQIALGTTGQGMPIFLGDVAEVRLGPDIRRGVADWNGEGEVAGGIIVMRFGENARAVIDRVREKLAELERNLPPGVAIKVGYDRSDLIDRAVATLTDTLIQEITVVALVCILFLLHARSELVAVFVVPTAVLASLLIMRLLGINANIMSLGGIAIAIGVMVDSSIVMVENAHKHLDREDERLEELSRAGQAAVPRDRRQMVLQAAQEVGPSLFFSLLVVTVSFLPVFVLSEQSGRLFRPLAYTKTFSMASAAFLAVTVIPVLMSLLITPRVLPKRFGWRRNLAVTLAAMVVPAAAILILPLPRYAEYRHWLAIGWVILAGMLLIPQKLIHEKVNPVSWLLQVVYRPFFILVMRFRWATITVAALVVLVSVYPLTRLGSEFMPPLEEGDLLYMPTTDPGISMTKARELLQQTDRLISQFPEVQSVLGKAGQAETATDPAPPSMLETTIMLHRDKSRWRQVPLDRFYSGWPAWARWLPGRIWSGRRPITVDELVHGYHLPGGVNVPGLNQVVQIPGLTNAWTMPIRTRIDMLSTGIRTPVGVKVMGTDLRALAELSERVAQVIRTSAETGPFTVSAFAEKSVGGNYIDIEIDRAEIARHNLKVADVQEVIASALGGTEATVTVEGLERYSVNVRYPPELRDNLDALRQTLVGTPSGAQVPLGQLARLSVHKGPPEVRTENARLTSWVFVDIAGVDVGTYVANARRAVAAAVAMPPGYSLAWSGQYEYMLQARQRLTVVVPLTLAAIVLLLYVSMRSWFRVVLIFLTTAVTATGAIWLMYWLDYHVSMAAVVGFIALLGLDAETSMVAMLYLDSSYERLKGEGRMRDRADLWWALHDGAVMRIRPKMMTICTSFVGLLPLMWASGAGADTMRRLAAPLIGGLVTSTIVELLIYPVIFYVYRGLRLPAKAAAAASPSAG